MRTGMSSLMDNLGQDGQWAVAMLVLNMAAIGLLWLLSRSGPLLPNTAAILGLG